MNRVHVTFVLLSVLFVFPLALSAKEPRILKTVSGVEYRIEKGTIRIFGHTLIPPKPLIEEFDSCADCVAVTEWKNGGFFIIDAGNPDDAYTYVWLYDRKKNVMTRLKIGRIHNANIIQYPDNMLEIRDVRGNLGYWESFLINLEQPDKFHHIFNLLYFDIRRGIYISYDFHNGEGVIVAGKFGDKKSLERFPLRLPTMSVYGPTVYNIRSIKIIGNKLIVEHVIDEGLMDLNKTVKTSVFTPQILKASQ